MTPRIISRPDHPVSRKDFSDAALKVLRRLRQQGFQAYLAGGAVRDLLMGRQPKDFDVVTDARPDEIRKVFRNCRLIGRRFRIAHIFFGQEIIEVATFRSMMLPVNETDVHPPDFITSSGVVVRDNVFGTPEEDAMRRDFTINALFYDSSDFSIIDYTGGVEDIQRRVVRCIGDPLQRYTEDPVRMIRAVRFASMLNFTMEERTAAAISDKAAMLSHASPSRLYDEILKVFFCGNAELVFEYLEKTGLFQVLFPEHAAYLMEHEQERPWLQRVMCQIDVWREAGMHLPVELFLALLFGPYHEHLAGGASGDAVYNESVAHLRRVNERVRIPKNIGHKVGVIMAMQHRFSSPATRRKRRLFHRPGFIEGLIFFKLRSFYTKTNTDIVAWWDEQRHHAENRLHTKRR